MDIFRSSAKICRHKIHIISPMCGQQNHVFIWIWWGSRRQADQFKFNEPAISHSHQLKNRSGDKGGRETNRQTNRQTTSVVALRKGLFFFYFFFKWHPPSRSIFCSQGPDSRTLRAAAGGSGRVLVWGLLAPNGTSGRRTPWPSRLLTPPGRTKEQPVRRSTAEGRWRSSRCVGASCNGEKSKG